MSTPRALLVDLSAAQAGGSAGEAARVASEVAAALLNVPGAVGALLLDPSLPLPGGLHPALLSSPLLRWNTATELRRGMAQGPVAYFVPAPAGAAPLPPLVAERAMPLVMLPGDAGRELSDHADLVVTPAAAASWSEIAEQVARAVERMEPPRAAGGSGAARLHVALVGALPPSGAPSAVLNARLAEALAQRCRLDLAGAEQPAREWLDRLGARHLSVEALSRHGLAASYDAVVHMLGGTAEDLAALQAARRLPGVVWLHDLALAEPHRAEAAESESPGAELAALLRRVYADRAPSPLLERLDGGDASAFDAAAERRYWLLLTGEVVREARAVVVGSAQAARRLRLDQGPSSPCPPITVIDAADVDVAAERLVALVAALHRGRAALDGLAA